jgi:CIC family chloride channel protein
MFVTGALAGVASAGLLALLRVVDHAAWPAAATVGQAFAAASPAHRIGALLIAGVITTVVRLFLRRSREDPASVLTLLWEQAGIISLRKTVARALLAVVDVGLGAALGREGPLKEIGGAIASRVARLAKLGLGHRRLVVACGTAAGISAAYNVPLGGALFGLEVLLGRIDLDMVAPMIVCCAVATHASRWLYGGAAGYHVPTYHLGDVDLLAQALALGIVIGALSAVVIKGLRWFATVEQWNARLAPFMPLIVLGTLGVAAAWLPQLLGNGYDVANAALNHELGLSLLVALPALRFVATASGRAARVPGGLLTPMLSIGALLGGLVGEAVCRIWPNATSPGAFALLGMGALFAGTAHAPFAAVVIASELSANYLLILPLVFACGAAALVSSGLEAGSLYRLGPRREPPPSEPTPQPRIPLHPTRKIPELMCAADLLLQVLSVDPRPMFVVDERGRLRGVVHPDTARARLAAERLPRLLIVDDLTDRDVPRLSVRASHEQARALFTRHDSLRFIPVVDDRAVLLGEASRDDFAS